MTHKPFIYKGAFYVNICTYFNDLKTSDAVYSIEELEYRAAYKIPGYRKALTKLRIYKIIYIRVYGEPNIDFTTEGYDGINLQYGNYRMII